MINSNFSNTEVDLSVIPHVTLISPELINQAVSEKGLLNG